eukprot:SAG22_NODE_2819_length_2180_cov_1.778952_1_plen_289_part_10
MKAFNKISTIEEYKQYWPGLLTGFAAWRPRDDGDNTNVVMLGQPRIVQYRGATRAKGQETTDDSANTRSLLETKMQEMVDSWSFQPLQAPFGGTCDLLSPNNNSDGGSSLWHTPRSDGAFDLADVVNISALIDHAAGNGKGTSWEPSCWLDTHTHILKHSFTLYLAGSARLASGELTMTAEENGNVVCSSAFENYEPFQRQMRPINFYTEMIFYIVVLYFLVLEFFEVWDCICASPFLIPQQICMKAIQLQLYQLRYLHEITSEVYDPRDKRTGKAFEFPDTADLIDVL